MEGMQKMADVEQGIKIEGEAQEQHSNPEVAQQQIEEKAKKSGWSPEENWRGNPEDWVPAKEFLGRQKLFDRIDSLKKALQSKQNDFAKAMRVICKSVAEMNEQAYRRALADLKAQRGLAIEDKNIEAVEAIDAEIDETKVRLADATALKKQPVQQTQETPDFVAWREANSWFTDNQEMRDDAIAIGVGHAAKNQNLTEKQVYDYVTTKIKKMYPEEFGKGKTNEESNNETNTTERNRKVSNVETGGRTAVVVKKGKTTTADDLDDTQKAVMKTLIKRGVFKELAAKNKRTEQEEYLAQYHENATKVR